MVLLVGCVTTNFWSDVKLSFEMTHISCVLQFTRDFFQAFLFFFFFFLVICRRKQGTPEDPEEGETIVSFYSKCILSAFLVPWLQESLLHSPNKENWLRNSGAGKGIQRPLKVTE